MSPMKQSFWQSPLTRSSVPKDKVTTPETLLGYLIGPFGALLSSGIFTSYLQVYLGKALELSSAYLSILQLVSTFLIVAANLIVGQLIERTRTMAGKARPWLLLSALTLSVASVLMFIMPLKARRAMCGLPLPITSTTPSRTRFTTPRTRRWFPCPPVTARSAASWRQ